MQAGYQLKKKHKGWVLTNNKYTKLPGSHKAFGPQGFGLHRSAEVKGLQDTKGSPKFGL